MKKLILILLLCLGGIAFSQTQTRQVETSNDVFIIKTSPTRSVYLQIDKCSMLFRDHQKDNFIKFLETHISLLEEASKLKVSENISENVLILTSDSSSISSSILMSRDNNRIRLFFRTQYSYKSAYLTLDDLKLLLQGFKDVYELNKADSRSKNDLMKLIAEAQLKFK